MASEETFDSGILLSQDEMDRILSSVRTESQRNSESEPSVELSQNELDALFATSTIKEEPPKKIERPKLISIVEGRTKWTQSQIDAFKAGSEMQLDVLANEPVEIMADGHCIALGVLIEKDGHKAVRFVSEV